jgi:hypothetical protein
LLTTTVPRRARRPRALWRRKSSRSASATRCKSRRQAAAYLMTPAVDGEALQRDCAKVCGPRQRLHAHHPRRHPRRRWRESRDPRNRRLRAEEKRKERKNQEGRASRSRQLTQPTAFPFPQFKFPLRPSQLSRGGRFILCRRCLGLGSYEDARSGDRRCRCGLTVSLAAACRWQGQAVQIKLRMIIWISNRAGKRMKNRGKKFFLQTV